MQEMSLNQSTCVALLYFSIMHKSSARAHDGMPLSFERESQRVPYLHPSTIMHGLSHSDEGRAYTRRCV